MTTKSTQIGSRRRWIWLPKGDGETVPVTEAIGYLGEEGENIPTAEQLRQNQNLHSVASASNDDGKSDDAFDIAGIGGGPKGYGSHSSPILR